MKASCLLPMSCFLLCFHPVARGATFATFDVIDDRFNQTSGDYTGPGLYDFFNATDGTFTPDGQNDLEVILSTVGAGTFGGVTYSGTVGATTTTGLVSSPVISGTPPSNNSGHRIMNTIDIRFLNGMVVTADNIMDFSFSSGNTGATSWEVTYTQFLDSAYNVIGSTPTLNPYFSHTSINGISGNTLVADSLGTVTGVGTATTVIGGSGPVNNTPAGFDTPLELGISGTTVIGGVRFVHFLEDVRGTSNTGNSMPTATINNLQLDNFIVNAPEPSRAVLLFGGLLGVTMKRRRSQSC